MLASRTSATRVSGLLLRGLNLICRNAAQISNKSQFGQRPDEPLGRVKLPWLHSVAVVVLKFVVVVVIAFAHGKKSKEERIARSAFFGIRLSSDRVTCAINEERAMLQDNDSRNSRDQKSAECSTPPIPQKAENCRDSS